MYHPLGYRVSVYTNKKCVISTFPSNAYLYAQYQGATTGNDPAASLGATMSSPFWDRFEVPPGSSPATWASTPSGTGDDGPGAGAGPTTAHSSTAGEGGGRGATVREAAAAALAAAVATSRETASRFTPGMSSDPLFSFASAETAAAAAAASSVSSEGSAAAGSRGSGDLAGATTSTATVGDARTIAPTGSASANATGGAPSGGGVSAAEIEAVTEWRAREAGGAGRADITPPEETGVVAAVAEEGGRKFPANRAGDGRWFEVGLNSHVRDGQVETRQGIRGEGTSGARQALPGLEGSEAAAGETAGATVGGSGGGFPSELPDSEEDQLMLAIALSLKSNGSGSSSRNSMSAATAGAGVAGAMLPSTSASATAGPFSTTDATPPTEADDAGVYTSPARTSSCLGGAAMGLDAARSVMGEVSARKKEAGPEGDTRAPVPEDPFDIFFREKSGSREGRGTLEEEVKAREIDRSLSAAKRCRVRFLLGGSECRIIVSYLVRVLKHTNANLRRLRLIFCLRLKSYVAAGFGRGSKIDTHRILRQWSGILHLVILPESLH